MIACVDRSDGVRIEAATRAWLEALQAGDDVFSQRFDIPVEPGWAVFPETLSFALELAREFPPEWGVFLVFDASERALVGNAGWKGAPVDGRAELGYAVAPNRRGRGIATAVVRELISRGARAGVRVVVAHTLPEHSASTRVLTRCGFTQVAEVIDPDDGPVWRWELRTEGP